MSIRGSLDTLNSQIAGGWAYEPTSGKPLLVQAMLNREVIGEAIADLYRGDLAAIGLGEGKCGYTITFHRPIDPLYLPFVVVKPDGGDVELPRYTPLGFIEFFAALHRTYPAAGLSRSVLGGLWTDRTDAAALLKGKTEIGQIDPKTAVDVAQLIQQGLAVVDGPGEHLPDTLGTAALVEAAAALLGGEHVLRLLRTVLEDHPVVLAAVPVGEEDTPLGQPSAEAALLSPNECLAVVAPLAAEPVEIDVVRGSHAFPEFTRDGLSRWTNAKVCEAAEMPASQHGLLDRFTVKPGTMAVIGPGLLYSVRGEKETRGLKLLIAAARGVPARFAKEGRKEFNRGGVRIWL